MGTIRKKPSKDPGATPAPIPVKPPRRPKPPKIDPVPPPRPEPEPEPSTATLGAPTGTIGGPLQIAYGRGGPWATVNAYDASFVRWGGLYGVPAAMLKAIMVIESGGQLIPNGNGYPNWGPMQLTSQEFGAGYWTPWDQVAKDLGVSIKSADGQVAIAAYVLGGKSGKTGTPEDIFLSSYYPIAGGLDVKGPDGHTQRQYLSDLHELMRQIDAAAGGTAPTPPPKPKPLTVKQVIDMIVGGASYPPVDYGWGADAGLNYYAYGVGHGTSRATQHTGYDVSLPLGTKLFTPISGVVDCVGSRGTPRWGQGCGAYADTISGGVGNITIFGDSGHKLTLGHCNQALVTPGQRVTAGQPVVTSGGMNGPHVHIEVSVLRNGSYWLLDPGPALIEAMGGSAPTIYAERQPFVLSDDNPEVWVEVVAESVPVLQYANPEADPVRAPLRKGEKFQAGTKALGTDGVWFWVTSIGSRIPETGTKEVAS